MGALPDIDSLRSEALAEFHKGNASEAAGKMQRIISGGNSVPCDRLLLADMWWADFQFEKALEAYRDEVLHAPNSVEVPLLAAKRLFSLGRFDAAAGYLEMAATRRTDDPVINRMLAELRDRQDRLLEAESLARDMMERFPGDARLVRSLAHTLRRSGRVEDAIVLLERQLADHPCTDDWRLRYELALGYDLKGEYAAAMRALLTAKAQLRPQALRHVAQWRADARRRTELARSVDRRMLTRWRDEARHLEAPGPIALLAGHPRSGTTLLEQILGSHASAVTTDETGILREQFTRPLVLKAASTAAAIDELNSFEPDQIASGRAFYFRATEAHTGESLDGRLLIEKDPLLTQDLVVPLRLLPESRVIMPIRDPRDVCLSFFFVLVPMNADSAPALDLVTCGASVALSLELWRYWRDVLPQPIHEVRYERLVLDPGRETQRLCGFLDLPWSEDLLNFHRRASPRGVRTPTYGDVRQPLYTRAIGRWMNYAQWLEPAMRPLERLLSDFGYSH